jgi:hypothetical protein
MRITGLLKLRPLIVISMTLVYVLLICAEMATHNTGARSKNSLELTSPFCRVSWSILSAPALRSHTLDRFEMKLKSSAGVKSINRIEPIDFLAANPTLGDATSRKKLADTLTPLLSTVIEAEGDFTWPRYMKARTLIEEASAAGTVQDYEELRLLASQQGRESAIDGNNLVFILLILALLVFIVLLVESSQVWKINREALSWGQALMVTLIESFVFYAACYVSLYKMQLPLASNLVPLEIAFAGVFVAALLRTWPMGLRKAN